MLLTSRASLNRLMLTLVDRQAIYMLGPQHAAGPMDYLTQWQVEAMMLELVGTYHERWSATSHAANPRPFPPGIREELRPRECPRILFLGPTVIAPPTPDEAFRMSWYNQSWISDGRAARYKFVAWTYTYAGHHTAALVVKETNRLVSFYFDSKGAPPHTCMQDDIINRCRLLAPCYGFDGENTVHLRSAGSVQPDNYQCGVWVVYFVAAVLYDRWRPWAYTLFGERAPVDISRMVPHGVIDVPILRSWMLPLRPN